jgi:hypothetical protein
MPWIIGIDEAGYGPNLGPFVMTSVACRVPAELAGASLWDVLRPAVRRPSEPADGRLLVEDSKVVYSSARGLLELETGVLAAAPPCRPGQPLPLASYVDWLCPAHHAELRAEPWYTGTTPLPLLAGGEGFGSCGDRFGTASRERGLSWGLVRSVVVCPARFNALLDRWDSKGAVLGLCLADLLRHNHALDEGDEPVAFFIDKHGGRNAYAPMLQHAFEDGMVLAREEGRERSIYRVAGVRRPVELTIQPRADAEHFCVALASMVSKYLRELLMREFNQFWQGHVPGLKATAGYPGDAARFFDAIQPAAEKLGITEAALWRRK